MGQVLELLQHPHAREDLEVGMTVTTRCGMRLCRSMAAPAADGLEIGMT
jgi:hypothetical protein